MPERVKGLLLPVATLVAFEIWARAVHLQSDSLAPPSAIAAALVEAFADGSVLVATRGTLISAFAGLTIGGAIGLIFGIALGIFHVFDRLMEVTIEAIRPIPSIALLPIALIALGFGYRMEIMIVAFACVWPILIPDSRSGWGNRATPDRSIARVASFSDGPGPQDHHSGGVAADLPGFPPSSRDRADRGRHSRDCDQPNRAWRCDHDRAAGATAGPNAGLSVVDRHGRMFAQYRPCGRAKSPVRTRGIGEGYGMNRSVLYGRAVSFIVAAGFVGLWQMIADLRLVSPVFLPGPDRAWASLLRGFTNGDLLAKLAGTLEHMAYGWLVASIAGIALGAMIGSSRTMRSYVAPSLEFLRPLPVSAIIPVAIAMFGLTQGMALFVIAFGAIWPMLLATVHGFAAVEPRLYEVARSLHMSRAAVIFRIALPSASPDILSGMRLSLTVALILSVVCEILAGLDGLGHWVLLSARSFRSADLFAGVILLGVIGYLTALAMSMVEKRLLRWRSSGH